MPGTKHPKTADQFFAKRDFESPVFVAEALHLCDTLALQHRAQGHTGRYVEILSDAFDTIRKDFPEAVTANSPMFVPTMPFPERALVPRPDGTLVLEPLLTLEARTRFLAHLLTDYVHHLKAKDPSRLTEAVAGVAVALKRLVSDTEGASRVLPFRREFPR